MCSARCRTRRWLVAVLGRIRLSRPRPSSDASCLSCGVALVDQLTAVLGDLPVGEEAANRPAAAADPVPGLMDLGDDTGLLQPVRRGQPGEAGADDHDPPRWRRRPCTRREGAERGRRRSRGRRVSQEVAPARAALLRRDVGGDPLNRGQHRCPRHTPLLSLVSGRPHPPRWTERPGAPAVPEWP